MLSSLMGPEGVYSQRQRLAKPWASVTVANSSVLMIHP
ncbi:hypothetical protein SynWH8101_1426 [Synechococcus sp. WH 8101]|nr:hypothetical protein SynWH8101_1426 [Synechococcus sp. WH 8101]QNI45241.1 hypothetical protein SynRCC2555_01458 [Synechococcus sp. WH 8101]